MAVVWNESAGVDRTANGGYTVSTENVILKPELNGRSEDTDVSELAEDIASRGQILPAICSKSPEGWPVLIAGHRRLRAIAELNKTLPVEGKVKLRFNYAPTKNDEEALDLTVAENRNRTDVNPLDDAYNINIYMVKFGRGLEEIGKKYFPGANTPEKVAKAVAWVKERQKLLELTPEAQEKLRKGEFSTSAAQQLAKLQPVAQNVILSKAEKEGKKLKVADAKAAVDETKPASERKQIKDNTPVKLLTKFKTGMEIAGALASEVLAKRFKKKPDVDVVVELAEQTLVICKTLNIPLESSSDGWAEANKNMETAITNL
jgi:ParB/RepB/Spo0J family partition protein